MIRDVFFIVYKNGRKLVLEHMATLFVRNLQISYMQKETCFKTYAS
jgi:hypothetical protein